MQVNSDTLGITVHNHYTEKTPIESGMKYRYPWTNVAEPYKATTLAVMTPVDGAWYKWMVDGHVQVRRFAFDQSNLKEFNLLLLLLPSFRAMALSSNAFSLRLAATML